MHTPEHIAARRGRPMGTAKPTTKEQISIRLDPEVIAHFKTTGPGWQARINKVLQAVIRRPNCQLVKLSGSVGGTRATSPTCESLWHLLLQTSCTCARASLSASNSRSNATTSGRSRCASAVRLNRCAAIAAS
ncbi:MAG TPA: BrnA antitoxin family protein [Novosphingobium sp.]|nr:BrnA antitoxin family protein [Novosphingobium sp.]